MAHRYKKYEVRTGEVIEPTRIRDNMQILGHELNGHVDRDNLPMKAITSKSIADDAFNIVETVAFDSISVPLEDQPIHYVDVQALKVTVDVPVDCVIIGHFGAWFEWETLAALTDELIDANGATIKTQYDAGEFGFLFYDDTQEHFIDFRMMVNGEDVCQTFSFPFARQSQSVYMTGAIPVSAGSIELKIQARMYRDNLGKREVIRGFKVTIRNRNLILHAKKR